MKQLLTVIGVAVVLSTFQGCLFVEKKTYKVTMTGQQTGTCTVTYTNIMSQRDDGKDVSFKDFAELVTDYLEGDKLDGDYPEGRIVNKRIYSKDGILCGEATIEFDTLATMKMYRYDRSAPLMMYMPQTNNETVEVSNGTYGGEEMPVLFWPSTAKELMFTLVAGSVDSTNVSLMRQFDVWNASQQPPKR
jgi:hypothetical protein